MLFANGTVLFTGLCFSQIEVEYGSLEIAELTLMSPSNVAIVTLNEKVISDFTIITKVRPHSNYINF